MFPYWNLQNVTLIHCNLYTDFWHPLFTKEKEDYVSTVPVAKVQFTRALRSRAFALMWIGQSISSLGNGAFSTALAWQVVVLTHSATLMGIILVAQVLPSLVFLLIGGIAADRFPRRLLLFWSDAGRGVVVLLIGTAKLVTPTASVASHRVSTHFWYCWSLLWSSISCNPTATCNARRLTLRKFAHGTYGTGWHTCWTSSGRDTCCYTRACKCIWL